MLGPRPFKSKDDMDKWLDEHRKVERSAPPPLENVVPDDAPVAAATRTRDL